MNVGRYLRGEDRHVGTARTTQPQPPQRTEQEPVAHPERHELQAKGEHPAPCARHCEANAFQIVIKNLKAQLAQPEQEPVAWATREDFYRELDRSVNRMRQQMEIKKVVMRCSDYDIALPVIDIRDGHVLVGQVTTPPQPEQEPDDGYCKACDGWKCTSKAGCVALDNPSQRTEQEPEAWYDKHGMVTHDPFEGVTPLYLTPPQRKPLTDEEIDKLLGPFPRYADEWSMTDFIRFARAIEAAHGIGENT